MTPLRPTSPSDRVDSNASGRGWDGSSRSPNAAVGPAGSDDRVYRGGPVYPVGRVDQVGRRYQAGRGDPRRRDGRVGPRHQAYRGDCRRQDGQVDPQAPVGSTVARRPADDRRWRDVVPPRAVAAESSRPPHRSRRLPHRRRNPDPDGCPSWVDRHPGNDLSRAATGDPAVVGRAAAPDDSSVDW